MVASLVAQARALGIVGCSFCLVAGLVAPWNVGSSQIRIEPIEGIPLQWQVDS